MDARPQHKQVSDKKMVLTQRRIALISFLLIALAAWLLIHFFWVTDRELIDAVLTQAAAAAQQGDAAAIMKFVSEDFSAEELNYEQLKARAELYFTTFGPTTISYLDKSKINVSGPRAVVDVDIFAKSKSIAFGRSRWRLSFKKTGKDWLIVRLEPLEVGGQPASWSNLGNFRE
jgi:hypothetical protein